MCILSLYVHATGTSGLHASARRAHAYDDACMQCGTRLDATTRVAAHVVHYRSPLLCPCAGELTLITCCKACNNAHNIRRHEKEPCLPRRARIWRRRHSSAPLLDRVTRLWCWRHRVIRPSAAAAPDAARDAARGDRGRNGGGEGVTTPRDGRNDTTSPKFKMSIESLCA